MNISYFEQHLEDCFDSWSKLASLLDEEMQSLSDFPIKEEYDAYDRWIVFTKDPDYEYIKVLFAFDGEFPIGMVLFAKEKKHLHIFELYVKAPYRHQGIGTELVHRVKEKHPGPIYLGVIAGNEEVMHFYQKLGFYIDRYTMICNNWKKEKNNES